MNTQKLQNKFGKIYKDFFEKCDIVASAPHSFLWSGDFSGFFEGLTISSKIPLRFYVGFENTNRPFEVAEEFFAYNPQKARFEIIRLDSNLVMKLKKLLQKDSNGKKLRFLSEITLGTSLGGLGAISACLAKIQNYSEKDHEKLFGNAWKIAKNLQTGRSLGATAYASLSPSRYPIAFHSKKSSYWAKPIDKISSHLPESPLWPIDFGLIFSGKLVQGATVIASANEIKKISQQRESSIKKLGLKKEPFWNDYLKFINQIAFQNLFALTELFKKGSTEYTQKFLFQTLNQYQNLLHFLEISNPNIDNIYSAIHQISGIAENRVGSGAKITGVGKGGEVLFALPFGGYRDKIEKKFGHSLHYASWRDGFEEEGTKIEQNLSTKQISPLTKSNYLIKIFYKNDFSIRLSETENIDHSNFNLIINAESQKIKIKNKTITSRSLPSQKSAAIILEKLLESKNFTIANKNLPGSYASSRFDLQSKITAPLSKITPLKFKIEGEMYDNFTLSLAPSSIKIALIKKI